LGRTVRQARGAGNDAHRTLAERPRIRSLFVTDRQLISSGGPLEPIVGYSRAVRVGDRVFVAGTAPQWPDDAVDPDPEVQTRRCFEIIGTALDEAGATFADVVRTRMYLVDAADFAAVSGVHAEHFRDVRPASTALVVKALLNPAWKVEIEVEAVIGSAVSARS
jgi:enamine deaminase RidA (YjgF/YER057c/UK114 family)